MSIVFVQHRQPAHPFIHPANVCLSNFSLLHLALDSLFELVLEVHLVVKGSLYDVLGGVIQSCKQRRADVGGEEHKNKLSHD